MSDTPTSEVLYRAADLIEERGWGQGTWKNIPGEPLCTEGAIFAAMGVTQSEAVICPAVRAVTDYVGRPAFLWNDDLFFDRVKELVATDLTSIAGLDALNAQAKAEGQAKVIAVLRAVAVIEAARENAEQDAEVFA